MNFVLQVIFKKNVIAGVNEGLLDKILFPAKNSQHWYNGNLIERLIHIISLSCQASKLIKIVDSYSY